VREGVGLAANTLARLRRARQLPEAGSYALGPALHVTIEVHRTLGGTAASVPELHIRCVAHRRATAIARAALAVLRMLGRGGRKPPCSVSFEVLRLDVDDRTPEQRKIDGQVYRLAEAGKFFAGFKPPQPRKRAKRAKRSRTGARRR
jgi:hypothetical protein